MNLGMITNEMVNRKISFSQIGGGSTQLSRDPSASNIYNNKARTNYQSQPALKGVSPMTNNEGAENAYTDMLGKKD